MLKTMRLLSSDGVGPPTISLLGDGELHTLALRQRDPWLLATNDEDVALASGELIVNGILDVDDVEASIVALTVGDDTYTTHVATTSSHSNHASVEADKVDNLACVIVSMRAISI
jgi:hypothetical protein